MVGRSFEYLRDCPLDPVGFIEHHANATPHAPALIHPAGIYSYQSLVAVIDRIANAFHDAGLRQGDIAAIHMSDNFSAFVSSFALARLGCACVMNLTQNQASAIPVKACIALNRPALDGIQQIEFQRDWLLAGQNPVARSGFAKGFKSTAATAVYTQSSGSTGQPKLVSSSLARLHRAVIDSLDHKYHRPAVSPCCVSLGFGSLWGYRQMLTILWTGGTLVLGNIHVSTASHFNALGIRHIAASTAQLAEWAEIARDVPIYFNTVDTVTTGGARLTPKLEDAVRRYICPNIYINYGSTETGLIAAGSADLLRQHPDAVGIVLDTVTVEIAGADGRALPHGVPGAVRVRTGSMADCDAPSRFEQGWFYTGDEGMLLKDGTLCIAGRNDGVLNISGTKYRLEEGEELLRECPGIADAALFLVHSELDVAQLRGAFVPGKDFDGDVFNKYLAKVPRLGPLLEINAIPRGGNGKILRHVLEDTYNEQLSRLKN